MSKLNTGEMTLKSIASNLLYYKKVSNDTTIDFEIGIKKIKREKLNKLNAWRHIGFQNQYKIKSIFSEEASKTSSPIFICASVIRRSID